MNFKLITTPTENWGAIVQILVNRGIEKENIEHYLHTSDEDINSFESLGVNNLKAAAAALIHAIQNNLKVIIIVDSDCDGFTSSALLINYLHVLFPYWVENCLDYSFHEGKQHGLADHIETLLECNYSLVICPDSSSNDYVEHKKLAENATQVIVLDHHEAERISENAIVINNQLSDYPNKDLSGVGVTWQFCRYIDSIMKTSYADKYLDLVALGNLADMMSLKSYETKYLINKGFKNIKNPFIYYMAQKNAFKLGTEITPMGAAFYIAPFVNAMNRSGTMIEKKLLFESMLNYKAFQMVPSTKRGHKLGEQEKLVEQAIRTATNVKNRQTREENKGLETLEGLIEKNNMLENKILLFLLQPGQIDTNIAGLIANKFMAKYQRPCCILTRVEEEDEEGLVHMYYRGSARGYEKSGVTNFKDICEAGPNVEFAQGHQNAFGLSIEFTYQGEKAITEFLEYINQYFKNISSEPIYNVDYIYEGNNVNPQNILAIGALDYLWGQDVDEPYVAIKNLKITKDMITIYAKSTNTLKITLPSKVSLMKFNVPEEECNKFQTDGFIELNVVGRCNVNEYNGWINAQIMIEDYEIIDSAKYFF